eukprot:COSAG04_NODE_1118_length_8195_cov_3.950963_1_plen_61_part_10
MSVGGRALPAEFALLFAEAKTFTLGAPSSAPRQHPSPPPLLHAGGGGALGEGPSAASLVRA